MTQSPILCAWPQLAVRPLNTGKTGSESCPAPEQIAFHNLEILMSIKESDILSVHPLIQAKEQARQNTVELLGFLGASSDDVIRLYADLDMSVCAEIPKSAVMYMEEEFDGIKGMVRLLILAEQQVTETRLRYVFARESSLASSSLARRTGIDRYSRNPFGPIKPTPPHLPWVECQRGCEDAFAENHVPRINSLRLRAASAAAQFGLGSVQYAVALLEAQTAESEGIGFLTSCISQCPRSPFQTSGEIVSEILGKYLGSS